MLRLGTGPLHNDTTAGDDQGQQDQDQAKDASWLHEISLMIPDHLDGVPWIIDFHVMGTVPVWALMNHA
jgi:hypothetical protein